MSEVAFHQVSLHSCSLHSRISRSAKGLTKYIRYDDSVFVHFTVSNFGMG